MDIDLAAVPDDVETLQRWVRTLATERASLTEAQAEIERLRLIVQKLQRSQFGRRAERLDDDQLQLGCKVLHADIARVEAILPSTTSRPRDRGPNDQACRRICPVRTSGSNLSIRCALAAAAYFMQSARLSARCSIILSFCLPAGEPLEKRSPKEFVDARGKRGRGSIVSNICSAVFPRAPLWGPVAARGPVSPKEKPRRRRARGSPASHSSRPELGGRRLV